MKQALRLLCAAVAFAACTESLPTALPELDASSIARMRITFSSGLDNEAVVFIDRGGAVTTFEPSIRLAPETSYFASPTDATPVEARLFDSGGVSLYPAVGMELRVSAADPRLLRFGLFTPLNGNLERLANGMTLLSVELVRKSDQAVVFGPFSLPVTVTK